MAYFDFDELLNRFKTWVLWIIIKAIFSTRELRKEAAAQCDSRPVQIPGVFYGINIHRGYQAIGEFFPDRCKIIRLDYILGFIKLTLIMACTSIFFFLLWKLVT